MIDGEKEALYNEVKLLVLAELKLFYEDGDYLEGFKLYAEYCRIVKFNIYRAMPVGTQSNEIARLYLAQGIDYIPKTFTATPWLRPEDIRDLIALRDELCDEEEDEEDEIESTSILSWLHKKCNRLMAHVQ